MCVVGLLLILAQYLLMSRYRRFLPLIFVFLAFREWIDTLIDVKKFGMYNICGTILSLNNSMTKIQQGNVCQWAQSTAYHTTQSL